METIKLSTEILAKVTLWKVADASGVEKRYSAKRYSAKTALLKARNAKLTAPFVVTGLLVHAETKPVIFYEENPDDLPLSSDLQTGEPFIFSNYDYQVSRQSDDLMEGEALYTENNLSGRPWQLWFNGALIASYKGYSSLRKRYETLREKWHLTAGSLPE